MGASLVMLLAFLAGGSGSDLVDYISPQQYWADKQVRVSVESMANELKPVAAADVSKLIDDLASPDAQVREGAENRIAALGTAALGPLHEASTSPVPSVAASAKRIINRIEAADRAPALRRLMAIRQLGELAKKEGVQVLEPLLKSDEPFVAEYAAEAIDRIDGKPFHRTHPTDLLPDVYLLPQASRAVIQILGPPGGPVNVEQELKRLPPGPGIDPAAMSQSIQKMLVSAAEQMGNMRFEALSIGISGDVGPNSGYVVAIGRGTYNSRAVAEWLHKQQVPSNHVTGVEIFQPPGAEMLVFFPDDHHAALVASPRGAALPTQEVIAAIRTGQGRLKGVADMRQLIDAAPAGQPIWAAAKVTPAYAQASVFAPFDTVQLSSHRDGDVIALSLNARGHDAQKAQAAAQFVQGGAAQLTRDMRNAQRTLPVLKTFADAMASVKCDAQDGNATLTAKLPGVQSGLFLLPMLMTHAEARIEPPAQAVPVPPAPVPPPKP